MTTAPAEQPHAINPTSDDEIDLRQVAGALGRRWPWIAGGGALGLVVTGLSLLTAKPVYQGEFQIVLSGEKAGGAASLLSQNPGLAALAGLGGSGGGDSIATEVQILNSPSVLRPVFDAVKARKPPEVAKVMRFQDWAKSAITAEEEKGTSVLNVEFRDTNEQLVLPITRMISQAYQSYSNRGRARELVNMIVNEAQIAVIKPQAEPAAGQPRLWLRQWSRLARWFACWQYRWCWCSKMDPPWVPRWEAAAAASKRPAPPPSRR